MRLAWTPSSDAFCGACVARHPIRALFRGASIARVSAIERAAMATDFVAQHGCEVSVPMATVNEGVRRGECNDRLGIRGETRSEPTRDRCWPKPSQHGPSRRMPSREPAEASYELNRVAT
jgi:hypothetical protein